MAFYLRAIRRNRWLESSPPEWLPDDDVIADPLADLNTTDNRLSVWYVPDSRDNLGRIVAALASNREKLIKLDYMLIDDETIERLGIRAIKRPGDSPDDYANTTWHYDLDQLSGRGLVELAKELLPKVDTRDRKFPPELEELIRTGIELSQISAAKLKPKLKQKLGLQGAEPS